MGPGSKIPCVVGRALFATTHWSVVLTAGDQQSPQAAAAVEQLCRTYWFPVYAYIRRQGCVAADAEDLTQGFFAHILSHGFLRQADPERGRFRSFILRALKFFLADESAKVQAQKRGGGQVRISLDTHTAETLYGRDHQTAWDPATLFERRWALALLEWVLCRLEEEFAESGRKPLFDQLRGCLVGESDSTTYAEIGAQLGMTEGAVKVAVHRLRRRYRELFREEVAHTVADPSGVDDEIRHIRKILTA